MSGSLAAVGARVRQADSARHPWIGGLVALLGVPLFVMVSPGGSLSLPTGASIDDRANLLGVPLSVLLLGALILGTRRFRPIHRSLSVADLCLALFIFMNISALLVGFAIYGTSLLAFAYFIQTFLPMAGFIVGRRLGQFDLTWLSRKLLTMAKLVLAAFAGVAITTLASGGRPWVYVGEALGPVAVPQARRFLPTVVAFALILFCRSRFATRVRPLEVVAAGVAIVLLSASHSRTALVILAVAFVMFVVFDTRTRLSSRIHFVLLASIAAVMLLGAWSSIDMQNAPMAISRFSGSNISAQVSSDRRESALRDSLYETMTSPLGRMYRPTKSETLGGTDAAYARVSNAENQLGEYGLRAGPLALVAVSIAIGSVLMRSRALLRSQDGRAPGIESLWLACSATVIGSVLTQPSLSQPYTGIVIWCGLGILYAWSDRTGAV